MQQILKEKKQVRIVVLSCVAFLMITHSYRWMNSMFNHDSLLVVQKDHAWQISIGRIFNPLYVWLRGEIVAPGNVAFLSSVFLIGAVLLCLKILKIRKPVSIVLCCGFLTTFETLAYVNASFLLSLDLDMLALLFAVLGAYFLVENVTKLYYAAGVLSITASLGLFQSYLEVTIILVCLRLLRDLLEGESPRKAFMTGLRSVILILISGMIYYVCLKAVWNYTGIAPANSVNGLVKMKQLTIPTLISFIGRAWKHTFYYLFESPLIAHKTISKWLYRGLGVFSLAGIVLIVLKKRINKHAIIMLVFLLLFMPLGMNVVYVLSQGFKHSLMTYSFSFFSVFSVMVYDILELDGIFQTKAKLIVPLMCSVLLLNHVLFANQLYIRNDLHSQAGIAFMTRLIGRMETTEGYKVGETPVLILGLVDENPSDYENKSFAFANDPLVGTSHHLAVSYYGTYQPFFNYVVGYPIKLIPLSEVNDYLNNPDIQSMPIYPAEGSLKMVNDVMVIRLSENLLPEELR